MRKMPHSSITLIYLILIGFYITANGFTSPHAHRSTYKYHLNNINNLPTSTLNKTQLFMAKKSRRSSDFKKFLKPTPTNILMFINAALFLAQKLFPTVQYTLMKVDRLISRGQTYRFLSACFVHGSLMHVGFNLYTLSYVGAEAEILFGKARFLVFYLCAGIMGNMITYLFKTSPYSLGASGAIWGLLGAMAVYYYRNQEVLGDFAEMRLSGLKRTILYNALYSFGGGIDGAGHAGGFVAGSLLSYLFGTRIFVKPPKTGYGRNRLVDRPIINYKPYWKQFIRNINPSSSDNNSLSTSSKYKNDDKDNEEEYNYY